MVSELHKRLLPQQDDDDKLPERVEGLIHYLERVAWLASYPGTTRYKYLQCVEGLDSLWGGKVKLDLLPGGFIDGRVSEKVLKAKHNLKNSDVEYRLCTSFQRERLIELIEKIELSNAFPPSPPLTLTHKLTIWTTGILILYSVPSYYAFSLRQFEQLKNFQLKEELPINWAGLGDLLYCTTQSLIDSVFFCLCIVVTVGPFSFHTMHFSYTRFPACFGIVYHSLACLASLVSFEPLDAGGRFQFGSYNEQIAVNVLKFGFAFILLLFEMRHSDVKGILVKSGALFRNHLLRWKWVKIYPFAWPFYTALAYVLYWCLVSFCTDLNSNVFFHSTRQIEFKPALQLMDNLQRERVERLFHFLFASGRAWGRSFVIVGLGFIYWFLLWAHNLSTKPESFEKLSYYYTGSKSSIFAFCTVKVWPLTRDFLPTLVADIVMHLHFKKIESELEAQQPHTKLLTWYINWYDGIPKVGIFFLFFLMCLYFMVLYVFKRELERAPIEVLERDPIPVWVWAFPRLKGSNTRTKQKGLPQTPPSQVNERYLSPRPSSPKQHI